MVVVVDVMEVKQRSFEATGLHCVGDVKRPCGLVDTLVLVCQFAVNGTTGTWLGVPAVNIADADGPAGEIVIF